jgi:hypothetical protein
MTSPFSDDLISAYLDGELTAQEQAYVEEQLRENADLRRMYNELRALRLTLQAMPVAEPPENLAERILRQAERRMLSGDQALADIPVAVIAADAIPWVATPRMFRDWRVALAAVVTLAASVLAMLWLPWHAGQDVARAPLAAPSAPALDDEFAKGEGAESADGAASFAVTAETTRVPTESASMARRAKMPPSSAPAQDSLAEREVDADPARSLRPEAVQSGGMPGAGGLGGSGQPAAGGAGADGTMDYPGMGGGAGHGAARQSAARVEQRDEPKRPGVHGGLAGGAQPAAAAANDAGAMLYDGAGAMGGQGMARGMVPGSMGLGSGMPPGAAGVPPSDRAASAGTDAQKGKMSLGFEYRAPANEQLIGQLISQLDRDQMLLVKVHVPQTEFVRSLDELRKSDRVDVWATDESVKAMPEGTALPEVMLQSDGVAGASISIVPSMVELRERLGGAGQNVLVVHGTADQIRQTLTNLAARPGVAIEPAPAKPDAIRDRSMVKSLSAGLRDLAPLARGADSPEQPADKKSEETTKPAQSSDRAEAEPAGEMGGRQLDPAKESKDVAKSVTMIYIYFRLRSDTTPAAPAAKSDNR